MKKLLVISILSLIPLSAFALDLFKDAQAHKQGLLKSIGNTRNYYEARGKALQIRTLHQSLHSLHLFDEAMYNDILQTLDEIIKAKDLNEILAIIDYHTIYDKYTKEEPQPIPVKRFRRPTHLAMKFDAPPVLE